MNNLSMKYCVVGNPRTINDEDKIWCISGCSDKYGSGIFAWCYDEEDASYWFNRMKDDKDFQELTFGKYLK